MRLKPVLISIVTALLLAPALPSSAQPEPDFHDDRAWPDTAGGRLAKELFDTFNSGDAARYRAFVEKSFAASFRAQIPADQHVGVLLEVFAQSQGFDFCCVRHHDPALPGNPLVVVGQNRLTGGWDGLLLEIEAAAPPRISGLQFFPARPPKDQPAEGLLTEAEAVRAIEEHVDKLAKAGVFSGAVLVARDGRTLYEHAAGEAEKGFHAPNRADTRFNLGSMNKMFTAVAVAQLVVQGKLGFDDPVSKWLGPDWLKKEYADAIQVRHLLSHTAGLGSFFSERWDRASRALYRTVEDYKPLVADEVPSFAPGQGWQYSNTGFVLAGAIVEKASGQDYFEYIRQNVYKPAGMERSDSYAMDEPVEDLAIGYFKDSGPGGMRWKNNLYVHVIQGGPAGGGFSTVGDLVRFGQALRSGKLVRPEMAELLWSPKPELGSPEYGFGFGVRGGPGDRVVGHSGGFPGISAQLDLYLDRGYSVAVLSNYDTVAGRVAERVRALLSRVRTD